MDKRFHMTYSRTRPQYLVPWMEEHDVPVLTNAVHRYSNYTDSFKDMWEYDVPHAVDAGGYNVLASNGGYPWDVEEYHEWLERHSDEVEWATVMDYACEERFDDIMTVRERMDKTIEHTVEHFNLDPSYQLLPVLQGRSVWNYVESYFDLEIEGIPLENVGVGTVCRVSSESQIAHISRQLPAYLDKVEWMHGFGVKVQSFNRDARFQSADSAAWTYGMTNGYMYGLESRGDGDYVLKRFDSDSNARKAVHSFQAYYAHVTNLLNGEPAVDPEPIIERQSYTDEEYQDYLDRLEKQ